MQVFWVVRTAALAEGAVLSHNYTTPHSSAHLHSHLQMGKGRAEGTTGGTATQLGTQTPHKW